MRRIILATPRDIPAIAALVETVVRETYGHFLAEAVPMPPPEVWSQSLIAVSGQDVIGVGRSRDDFISDLWVVKEWRGRGVGAQLLSSLEKQLESRGYIQGRLRVVAENTRARRFYHANGWREQRLYPHERDGHLMADFSKAL